MSTYTQMKQYFITPLYNLTNNTSTTTKHTITKIKFKLVFKKFVIYLYYISETTDIILKAFRIFNYFIIY